MGGWVGANYAGEGEGFVNERWCSNHSELEQSGWHY